MKNPAAVIPGAVEALQALGRVGVEDGGVPIKTVGLVQLRASMINGWVHSGFVKKTGDTDERLHAVAVWRDAPFFNEAERAALALTDAITRLSDRDDPVPDEVWHEAARHYDEKALASLVICIANMNVWNRLNVATRQTAGEILHIGQVRSSDGTTITYERRGTTGGPPVIMVDGATCYRAFGPATGLSPLLAADLTVYSYDRRGRGDSGDTKPYSVQREVEDLQAVVEAAGGENVGIYGMSSGAVLALEAAAAGVRGLGKLALWEPPLANTDGETDVRPKLDELLAAGRNTDAVDLFQSSIGVPEHVRVGMQRSPFWPAVEAIAPTILYDLAISRESSVDRYRSVTLPALVIDTNTNERLHNDSLSVADALQNSRHHLIPSAGVGRPVTAYLLKELVSFFTS